MKPRTILGKVIPALAEFFDQESGLFQVDVNERSLTHKLAEHLKPKFDDKGWHIDCEYNRLGNLVKRLPDPETVKTGDTAGKTIFPDIIVHKRGQTENLLVIEVKKSSNNDLQGDECKLRGLTKSDGDYSYRCGLHLVIDCDQKQLSRSDVYTNGAKDVELTAWFSRKVTALKKIDIQNP